MNRTRAGIKLYTEMVIPGKAVASGWVFQKPRPAGALVLGLYQGNACFQKLGVGSRSRQNKALGGSEPLLEPCFTLVPMGSVGTRVVQS